MLNDARKSGYVRVRVDGNLYDLSEEIKLEKNKKHSIEVVVDRVVVRPDARSRITDSVETASALSGGLVLADVIGGETLTFSQNYACEDCGISIEELTPRMFSFNNPYGACPTCTGLGIQMKIDPDRIIPNRKLSIAEGAIRASGWSNAEPGSISRMYYDALGKRFGFTMDTPLCDLLRGCVGRVAVRYARRTAGTVGQALFGQHDEPAVRGHHQQSGTPLPRDEQRLYACRD